MKKPKLRTIVQEIYGPILDLPGFVRVYCVYDHDTKLRHVYLTEEASKGRCIRDVIPSADRCDLEDEAKMMFKSKDNGLEEN